MVAISEFFTIMVFSKDSQPAKEIAFTEYKPGSETDFSEVLPEIV